MTTQAKQRPKLEMISTPQVPQEPKGVEFTREMFDALHFLPPLLERSRQMNPALVPLNVIAQIARARELISDAQREAPPSWTAVRVSQELWELIKDWPPLMERCRLTPKIPFSGTEVGAIVLSRTEWPEVGE